MKQVTLNDLLQGLTYPEAGSKFYDILREVITVNETIQVNMEGVTGLPTMFMNTSFGKIMSEFGVERLKKSMIFKNISKVQIERIGKYFKDYTEVYNPPA